MGVEDAGNIWPILLKTTDLSAKLKCQHLVEKYLNHSEDGELLEAIYSHFTKPVPCIRDGIKSIDWEAYTKQ